MKKKEFNINDWQNDKNKDKQNSHSEAKSNHTVADSCKADDITKTQIKRDIEIIIQRIEAQKIDITKTYADWRDIGFALSDEFGESGRNFFHRLSQFHQSYNSQECDLQYSKCLKAKGQGIAIQTIFYKAKQSGIDINTINDQESDKSINSANIFNTPTIPNEVYSNLPDFLKACTDMFEEPIEKDVFLIGAIGVLSACLPNIFGLYFDEPISAHLYVFITAPAGSGKGKLKWAKQLGMAIHKEIVRVSKIKKSKYIQELEDYNNLSKNQRLGVVKPIEPKCKMFFVPANSSSSAFIQALSDNDFKGIIFETEADTLSGTLKQDWGNFSDVLRKAFHHESTNMFRRKDNEHIEIEDPHLAIVISGTPKQVHNMIPDVENGLFSRFLYYAFEDFSDFKNPFLSHCQVNYIDFFNQQGVKIHELYQLLTKLQLPLKFELTEKQGADFTFKFDELFKRNRMLLGNDFNANSRRLGLITFRIAMILSAIRILETGDVSTIIVCNENDYQTALTIAFTLEKHAIDVFRNLPNNQLNGIKLNYYNALPKEFNRQKYLEIAAAQNIKDKTAEKYITQFRENKLLLHEHNNYKKI